MADTVLKTRIRSDLEWIRDCPSLVDSPLVFEECFSLPVGRVPLNSIAEAVGLRASHRVGYYFEELVAAYLRSHPDVSDLRHGIQVQEGKRTLGEVDFLFSWRGRKMHLETALKFFLFLEEGAENGSRYPGPNARDSFEQKWSRMENVQIPFGRAHFPEVEESHLLVKGIVFYPPDSVRPGSVPDGMNADHRVGEWIRFSDLDLWLETRGEVSASILEKPFWLSPPSMRTWEESGELRQEVRSRFGGVERPLMVSVSDCGERETLRLCIVPDCWPDASGRKF